MLRAQADVCPDKNHTGVRTPVSVGVCGFGRCGSTMVMAMLDAGGIPPVAGTDPRSFELQDLGVLAGLAGEDLDARAVKLLDAVLYYEDPRNVMPAVDVDWRFVWLDRKPGEQARSQVKFLEGLVGVQLRRGAVTELRRSYERDRLKALDRLGALGEVLVLPYEHVLRDPQAAAAQLREFTRPIHNGWFKTYDAAQAVHRRDGRCRPDLAFELHGTVA